MTKLLSQHWLEVLADHGRCHWIKTCLVFISFNPYSWQIRAGPNFWLLLRALLSVHGQTRGAVVSLALWNADVPLQILLWDVGVLLLLVLWLHTFHSEHEVWLRVLSIHPLLASKQATLAMSLVTSWAWWNHRVWPVSLWSQKSKLLLHSCRDPVLFRLRVVRDLYFDISFFEQLIESNLMLLRGLLASPSSLDLDFFFVAHFDILGVGSCNDLVVLHFVV